MNYNVAVQTKNVLECYQTCKGVSSCAAFAFTPSSDENCDLYDGGPYTKGSGIAGSKCFIIVPGTFVSLRRSICHYHNFLAYSILYVISVWCLSY